MWKFPQTFEIDPTASVTTDEQRESWRAIVENANCNQIPNYSSEDGVDQNSPFNMAAESNAPATDRSEDKSAQAGNNGSEHIGKIQADGGNKLVNTFPPYGYFFLPDRQYYGSLAWIPVFTPYENPQRTLDPGLSLVPPLPPHPPPPLTPPPPPPLPNSSPPKLSPSCQTSRIIPPQTYQSKSKKSTRKSSKHRYQSNQAHKVNCIKEFISSPADETSILDMFPLSPFRSFLPTPTLWKPFHSEKSSSKTVSMKHANSPPKSNFCYPSSNRKKYFAERLPSFIGDTVKLPINHLSPNGSAEASLNHTQAPGNETLLFEQPAPGNKEQKRSSSSTGNTNKYQDLSGQYISFENSGYSCSVENSRETVPEPKATAPIYSDDDYINEDTVPVAKFNDRKEKYMEIQLHVEPSITNSDRSEVYYMFLNLYVV